MLNIDVALNDGINPRPWEVYNSGSMSVIQTVLLKGIHFSVSERLIEQVSW